MICGETKSLGLTVKVLRNGELCGRHCQSLTMNIVTIRARSKMPSYFLPSPKPGRAPELIEIHPGESEGSQGPSLPAYLHIPSGQRLSVDFERRYPMILNTNNTVNS